MSIDFQRTPNPNPATAQQREEILAAPGFGQHFTDHMVTIEWTGDVQTLKDGKSKGKKKDDKKKQ